MVIPFTKLWNSKKIFYSDVMELNTILLVIKIFTFQRPLCFRVLNIRFYPLKIKEYQHFEFKINRSLRRFSAVFKIKQ